MAENLQAAVKKFAQDLADKVESFVGDISELEVRTYTTPHDQTEFLINEKPDIGKIATQGTIALRAYTQISFDGDTTICVPLDENEEIDRTVWSMHQTMVHAAMTNRATMIETIGNAAAAALNALRKANE